MIYIMVCGHMVQVRTRVSIINASLYTERVKNRMVWYTLDNAIFKRIYMTETIVVIEYGSKIIKNLYYFHQIFLLFDIIQILLIIIVEMLLAAVLSLFLFGLWAVIELSLTWITCDFA